MKRIISKLLIVFGAISLLFAPQVAFASGGVNTNFDITINKNCDSNWTPDCAAYQDPKPIEKAEGLVKTVIGWASLLVGLACVGFIIWGGIMYSAAFGDPSKIQKAKMIIISAIIGLVIALISGFIVTVALGALGL